MSAKDVLALIEQFETAFDPFHVQMQKYLKELVQHLSVIWKKIKEAKEENEKLMETIKEQNSELTSLKTESEELDKKITEIKNTREELTSENNKLNTELETAISDLKKPQFELETLNSKLKETNGKIDTLESEKATLNETKVKNENREQELNSNHTTRMEELEKMLTELKDKNFFTSFVIDNSDEEIHEVGILATIMEKGKTTLDDLKKQLDIPPIMAVRTIKQLAVKEIINLNENTNEITMK